MSVRGKGRIFQRKSSAFWLCAYYLRGKEHRESTGESDAANAKKYLERRLYEVGADKIGAKKFVGPQAERIKISCGVMFAEQRKPDCGCLCCALECDFRLRDKASPQNLSNFRRVRRDFALRRATSLTSEQVDNYIERLLAEDYAPASANRLTQLLGQAFNLAIRQKRLSTSPLIRRLSEAGNVRQGFFSDSEFRTVASNLPEDLRDFVQFGYLTGWRKHEITTLTWENVDGDVIRLRAENAKIRESRSVAIEGELSELIERRRTARQVKTTNGVTLASLIFHRQGQPVGDFRKAWATACLMAGLGKFVCRNCGGAVDPLYKCESCAREWAREELKYVGRIFHDFRRTAVRDMVRAGVPETVAMSISGHKTRSMFDRYNIHDERDQREALRATQAYRQQQAVAQREKLTTMPQRSAGIN